MGREIYKGTNRQNGEVENFVAKNFSPGDIAIYSKWREKMKSLQMRRVNWGERTQKKGKRDVEEGAWE